MKTKLVARNALTGEVTTITEKEEHCNTFLSRTVIQRIIQEALEAGDTVELRMEPE